MLSINSACSDFSPHWRGLKVIQYYWRPATPKFFYFSLPVITWKQSMGRTQIHAASTGLGEAVGFTVGGPHGPGLIVSHHGRARLRSDHRQLWFRRFNSQTGYARKHLQSTPHPGLTLMHTTLHPSLMTTREHNEFLTIRAVCSAKYQSIGWLEVGITLHQKIHHEKAKF